MKKAEHLLGLSYYSYLSTHIYLKTVFVFFQHLFGNASAQLLGVDHITFGEAFESHEQDA